MSTALRLLILEDDPLDAELEVAMLEEAGYVCQWERVETRAEFLACLDASNCDIILADYNLPAFDGLTALQMFLDLDLDLPFILVSGTLGEETAIESLKAGATDYVLKDRLARLGPVVERALREKEERWQRRRVEEERAQLLVQVQEQAQRVQQIMDTVPEGVLLLDAGGRVVLANPVAERDIAVLADAEVGDTLTHLGDRPLAELLTSPPQGLWHEVRTDTQTFEIIARPMEPSLRPTADGRLPNGNGLEPENWVLVINDVTQEREVERRAQQQERLAAVGQLAAGIAHDFNNLLTTIILYAQMGLRTPDLSPGSTRSFETILDESRKAAELVQQILDFSRHAMLKVQTLDLKSFTGEVIDILRRTIPENVHLTLTVGPQEYVVEADPTRIQQALLNLATNARDAMPEGGELRFELSCVEVGPDDEPPVAAPRVPPGRWVCLTTSDTGTGMSEEAQAHLFEPFFTTKPVGKGTGLGLAQVYGIIRQHEGYIGVETEIGKGTTFHIYLPACEAEEKVAVEEVSVTLQGRGETILLVEDEEKLREGGRRILESLDYRVLTAANGRKALEVYEAEGGVDLVLTDLVMPEMGGKRLMRTLGRTNPGLKGLAITGYSVQEDLQALKEVGFLDVVYKPLDMDRLARAVRRALDDTS
jgi:two-component system cell cycle sensor histidine kinase/response regulator CckA